MPIVDRGNDETVNLNLILEVINKQGETLHAEIAEQGTASRAKTEAIFHELDSGIKDLQAHNRKQNGTISELVRDVEYLKREDVGTKKRTRDLKNFQVHCEAVKLAVFFKKRWWAMILILCVVFGFMEWLTHDSMLLKRISDIFHNINLFKP